MTSLTTLVVEKLTRYFMQSHVILPRDAIRSRERARLCHGKLSVRLSVTLRYLDR